MTRIDERRRLFEAKLKEMSEDGVVKCNPKETVAYDPPEEDETSISPKNGGAPFSTVKSQETTGGKPVEGQHAFSPLSLDDYRMRYLQPVRIREKTAFTMNVETLQILRNVLQDLGERVSMASYIDNILRAHLKEYKELLNNATARQRRKTTITL